MSLVEEALSDNTLAEDLINRYIQEAFPTIEYYRSKSFLHGFIYVRLGTYDKYKYEFHDVPLPFLSNKRFVSTGSLLLWGNFSRSRVSHTYVKNILDRQWYLHKLLGSTTVYEKATSPITEVSNLLGLTNFSRMRSKMRLLSPSSVHAMMMVLESAEASLYRNLHDFLSLTEVDLKILVESIYHKNTER
jgi:hypothetical protein